MYLIPRSYEAKLGITNPTNHPISIRTRTTLLTVGTRTYEPWQATEASRVEPYEYKEIELTFAVEDDDAVRSGNFELVVSPAVGAPVKVSGQFPLGVASRNGL